MVIVVKIIIILVEGGWKVKGLKYRLVKKSQVPENHFFEGRGI
jgi:hypothetical protein